MFYLIIDGKRDDNNVYFLNGVTEADLMALAEKNDGSVLSLIHIYGGILEDCPRKSDALLLPAGEIDALGSQHRVHALW